MSESISKNNELENEMSLDMSYFWYSDVCLIQVSLSNSPFSLKSAYFEYVSTLDPILPRSTHDCFAWIDNFNPVSL